MLPPCYHRMMGRAGMARVLPSDRVARDLRGRQGRPAHRSTPALQPAPVRRRVDRRRAGPPHTGPGRSRRSDRRARVSRAVPRERRVRRPDERARAPAPHRSADASTRSSAPSSSSGSARRSISTNRTAPRRTCSRRCSTTATRCRPIRGTACWTGGRFPSIATPGCVRSPGGRAPINGSAPACATS